MAADFPFPFGLVRFAAQGREGEGKIHVCADCN